MNTITNTTPWDVKFFVLIDRSAFLEKTSISLKFDEDIQVGQFFQYSIS